jgi:hypothetical protein
MYFILLNFIFLQIYLVKVNPVWIWLNPEYRVKRTEGLPDYWEIMHFKKNFDH